MTAAGYDAYITGFVPEYAVMQQRVVDAVAALLPGPGPVAVIEVGVGTGALAFRMLSALDLSRYYGFESSPELAALASARLSVFAAKVTVSRRDFRRSSWPSGVNAVVSTLTFHYLSNAEKRDAFRKAFRALSPGGVLVIGDRVISAARRINSIYRGRMRKFWQRTTRSWTPGDRKRHKTFDDPHEAPWTLDDQLQWLREAGFEAVECIWKDYNYCVFCGMKPVGAQRAKS